MKIYPILIIIILTGWSASSSSTCQEVSFNHLKPTEGNFCWNCQNDSQNSQVLIPTLSCFEKSISSRDSEDDRNTICDNTGLKTIVGPVCLKNNEEYIKMTANAFHEISQCLDIEKPEFLFALLNRESRFQITARSKTGASCYGQLTGIAVAQINSMGSINVKNLNNCKSLTKNWKRLEAHQKSNGDWYRTKQSICTAHSNPYVCLFYSAVYYRKALKEAKKLVENLNIVTVKFHSNPSHVLYFKSESDYKKYMTKNRLEISDIKERKNISIFQDKEIVAQSIAFQGYNGGPESLRDLFRAYVNTIKGVLWSKEKISKLYQKEIFNKKPYGIPSSDFIKTFGKYVDRHKSDDTLYPEETETGAFARKVFEDFHSVTKDSSSCGGLPKVHVPKNQFNAQDII